MTLVYIELWLLVVMNYFWEKKDDIAGYKLLVFSTQNLSMQLTNHHTTYLNTNPLSNNTIISSLPKQTSCCQFLHITNSDCIIIIIISISSKLCLQRTTWSRLFNFLASFLLKHTTLKSQILILFFSCWDQMDLFSSILQSSHFLNPDFESFTTFTSNPTYVFYFPCPPFPFLQQYLKAKPQPHKTLHFQQYCSNHWKETHKN